VHNLVTVYSDALAGFIYKVIRLDVLHVYQYQLDAYSM